MDTSRDPIDDWLQDLEPDQPLAVAQPEYESPSRWRPVVVGGLVVVAVALLALVVLVVRGGAPSPLRDTSDLGQIVPSTTEGTSGQVNVDGATTPGEGLASNGQPEVATTQEAIQERVAPVPPDVALGLVAQGEEDPHNQHAESEPHDGLRDDRVAQLLVSAGSQWMTHAGAEQAVLAKVNGERQGLNQPHGVAVRAVQSLPLADVGRLVQVKVWAPDGMQNQWVVPVREDGVALAEPWLISSAQVAASDTPPMPTGKVDAQEATAVLTKAGWTNVEVTASGPHPTIPDVLIVAMMAIPPNGNQAIPSTVWLGGPSGARHVMGI